MTIKTIKTEKKLLKRIIHVSDIHIRLYKRKTEYREVFKELYKEINNIYKDDDIIVVAGDILHAKTDLTPEALDITFNFLKSLADITDTIVIAGNHDANLNNLKRMDALSPIIKNLNHPKLHYLKNTGLYKIDNVVFSVMGVFEPFDKYILADRIPDEYIKIAMFHGPVQGSQTDTGYKISSEKMVTSFFNGFDIVILGDIHKRQTLQDYIIIKNPNVTAETGSFFEKLNKEYDTDYGSDIKKPAIEYPGSLIQQNYGESLRNHGFLIWDIEKRSSTFHEVTNRFGYVTLNVDKGEITTDISYMPEKPKVRLKMSDTNAAELKRLLINIRKKYKPLEISVNRINSLIDKQDSITRVDLSNIREVDFQNSLIEDYLSTNFGVEDEMLREVFDINKELNKALPVTDVTRNVIWKPKKFKFSNMFSYGENNVIDFSKMNGIVGLFSTNASGKTSLLEAFTFCLFDKCSKTFKAGSIMNNRKKEFSCELNFELNGSDYFIKRIAKMNKKGSAAVKVDFYKMMSDGSKYSLNGEQRRDTDNIIKTYIGSYEDFILTSISSQNNPANFIDKTQTERKDLLSQFLDITIFDSLYDLGSEKVKEYETLMKQHIDRDFDFEIEEMDSSLRVLDNDYNILNTEKDSVTIKKDLLNDESMDLAKELIFIDDSIIDIDGLETKKKKINEFLDKFDDEIKPINALIDEKMEEYKELKLEFELIDGGILNTKKDELTVLEDGLSVINKNINTLKLEVKHKLETTEKLLKVEYDENCNFCMNNIFVKDAIKTKKELADDKTTSDKLISDKTRLTNDISKLSYIRDELENYTKLETDMNTIRVDALEYKTKSSKIEIKVSDLNSELYKTDEKIKKYYTSKKDIEANIIIEDKIAKLDIDIVTLTGEIKSIDLDLRDKHGEVISVQEKKRGILLIVDEFRKMEEKQMAYQYYLDAIRRDSIPYNLISEIIPIIENEINNILNQIVDFNVMLDVDSKNINVNIVYDVDRMWPLDMASGMEKFISGMSIRMALINISNLPRANFIAIDEGFSTLDGENSSNLPIMFDYLKTQTDFIFVISHQEYMRDYVDISLDLKRER